MGEPFSYEWVEGGLEIKVWYLETSRNIQEFKQFVEEWFDEGVVVFRFNLSQARGVSDEGMGAIRDVLGFLRRKDVEVEFFGLNSRSIFLRTLMSQMGHFETSEGDGDSITFN